MTMGNIDQKYRNLKRRLRISIIVFLCLLSYAGVTFWNQMAKLDEAKSQAAELDKKLAEKQKTNEDIRREIIRMNTPEYLEQKIAKELHYVKQGEVLLFTPKPAASNP